MTVSQPAISNHRDQPKSLFAMNRMFKVPSRLTKRQIVSSLFCLLILGTTAWARQSSAQDYASSVVGTEFDFILDTDPSTFLCVEYKGQGLREMPDKTGPSRLKQQAFILVAYFDDGTSIDMAIDSDFKTEDAAREEALRYAPRLGKLPTSLRRGVKRVVVHKSEQNATAFSDVGLIVLYSDNATRRISTHDLEETIFHESVHASWDKPHAASPQWLEAQASDGVFVTRYAKKNPKGEDLAESALFAYTLIHHPERVPADDAARIRSTMPGRIAFVQTLLPPDKPIFYPVGPKYECDGSGETFTVTAENPESGRDIDEPATGRCDVDITNVGELSDILSNALMHGLDQNSSAVSLFLADAKTSCDTADELIEATGAEFGIGKATLNAEIEKFFHCNCSHGDLVVADVEVAPSSPVLASPGATVDAVLSGSDLASNDILSSLRMIACLLVLLLVVNASMLVVLTRRSKSQA